MQISRIQLNQPFGYKLTSSFENRFSYFPKLLNDLKAEGNDRLILDYDNNNIQLSIVPDNQEEILKSSSINNLSVKSIKELEKDMISAYLCQSVKKGQLPETANILLENFPHLSEIINTIKNNKNFLRMSNHNKERIQNQNEVLKQN